MLGKINKKEIKTQKDKDAITKKKTNKTKKLN